MVSLLFLHPVGNMAPLEDDTHPCYKKDNLRLVIENVGILVHTLWWLLWGRGTRIAIASMEGQRLTERAMACNSL